VETREAPGWKRHDPGLDIGTDERPELCILNEDLKPSIFKVDKIDLTELALPFKRPNAAYLTL
jgi:hypothetical protein